MIICKNCGSELEEGSVFCSHCGTQMPISNPLGTQTNRNFVHGDQDNSVRISTTTNIYNSAPAKDPNEELECCVCHFPIDSRLRFQQQCTRCHRFFCHKHIKDNLCFDCEKEKELDAFEFEKLGNGKYSILKLKNNHDSVVVVPSFVESIEEGAFEGSSIIKVSLNEGIIRIGKRAFANCKLLTGINYPSTLSMIESEAFLDCCNLSIGPNLNCKTLINDTAFDGTKWKALLQKAAEEYVAKLEQEARAKKQAEARAMEIAAEQKRKQEEEEVKRLRAEEAKRQEQIALEKERRAKEAEQQRIRQQKADQARIDEMKRHAEERARQVGQERIRYEEKKRNMRRKILIPLVIGVILGLLGLGISIVMYLGTTDSNLHTPEILQTYGGQFQAFGHSDAGRITFTSCDENGKVVGFFEYGMDTSYGKYEISGQISNKTKKGDLTVSVVLGTCIKNSIYSSPMDFTAKITDSYSRFICEDYNMDWAVIKSNENETNMDKETGITISSVSDLQKLTNSAETYTLKNDIDLSGVSWNPIEGFSGVLDGNGYTIKNLTINTSSSNVGFFSTLSGTVKNVKLENAKIIVSGRYENVGILCGTLTGNADTISVSGTVTASMSSNVGGIFGTINSREKTDTSTTNINSMNNSSSVSALNNVGGIVGKINKDTYDGSALNIQNAVNTGKISSSGGEYVGGIVGYLYAESQYGSTNVLIDQVNNSGEVIGKLHVGGIAGFAKSDDGTSAITNAVVNATIKGEAYVGGIAGELVSIAIKDSQNTGSHVSATGYTMQGTTKCAYLGGFAGKGYSASNCTNEVELNYTGGGSYVGGIMGFSDGSNMSDLKNDATITGADYVGGLFGIIQRGSMDGYTLDFQRFTNSCAVSGNNYVGGILGSCDVSSQYGSACLIITTFKNQANITGNAYVGGCIGFGQTDSSESNMMDCSSTGTITGTSDYGEIAGKLENIKLQ